MQKYLIRNIQIVNEGSITTADVLIVGERIEKIAAQITQPHGNCMEIDGTAKYLLPGVIDDQVHFREPGLTHKACIYTESRAAVAGGTTSFMEMPNTVPPALTQALLQEKYDLAAKAALANYSFYMGTSNTNADEVLRTNEKKNSICGIKIFMGSSTGNMLVDNYLSLQKIFSESEVLIATHCEEESMIRENMARLKEQKDMLDPSDHPVVRNAAECFESSFKAVQLAKKYGTRLHILHISTEKELQLFTNMVPLEEKRITAEVCVHHLHFTSNNYAQYGNLIKCNPAIKAPHNREALWEALLDDRLDVIATDHAPHLLQEKLPNNEAFRESWPTWQGKAAPTAGGLDGAAGVPLVQHALLLMLHYYKQGQISLEKIAEKMSHAVAACFQIQERGYIREGYFADLVIVDLGENTTVSKQNILYKCGWSPFEGQSFPATITHTFVSGHLAYENGNIKDNKLGMRLQFSRS